MALPESGHFTVDVYKSENVLFIDVFDHKTGRCVALVRPLVFLVSTFAHCTCIFLKKFDGKR